MDEKSIPRPGDWEIKVIVWQRHVRGDSVAAIIRHFELQAGSPGYPEAAPARETVNKLVKELPTLSPALRATLPSEVQEFLQKHHPTHPHREPGKVDSVHSPYEETSHKQKIRKLAKALAMKVSLPSLWDKDLWRDLPLEFQTGKYSLPIGTVQISENRQIKVNYYDIGAEVAEPHLVNGLYSHLSSSGLSRFAELVGDKGMLVNWVGENEEYSQAALKFLKLIADDVRGYKARVYFHDELKPGLTRWFIIIAWHDAIVKASGYSRIDDSWYKPHENIPNTGLWKLNCGAYAVGIAKSKRTLKTYENWHKKLRVKHAQHSLAKDVATKSQGLSNMAQDIRQRLQVFVDMERLPGHCELCTRAGEHRVKQKDYDETLKSNTGR